MAKSQDTEEMTTRNSPTWKNAWVCEKSIEAPAKKEVNADRDTGQMASEAAMRMRCRGQPGGEIESLNENTEKKKNRQTFIWHCCSIMESVVE